MQGFPATTGTLISGFVALLATACEPQTENPRPTQRPSVEEAMPMDLPEDRAGDRARRFDCESGHQVELVGNDIARVTLADGRVIELPRERGGVAEYRGEALTFDLDDAGSSGMLGQDEVGGFDCTAAG